MAYFLSFSYNNHDSSVSVADEQRVLVVAEAERLFRRKKMACTFAEMEKLISFALDYCGITIDQVSGVACTGFSNLHLAPKERDNTWTATYRVSVLGRTFDAFVVNHHLSHAGMVHAYDEVDTAYIDVIDGGGDLDACHFAYAYRNGRLQPMPKLPLHERFSSRFYDCVSLFIYGRMNCEGHLMGLSALGEADEAIVSLLSDNIELFHSVSYDDSLAFLGAAFGVGRSRFDKDITDLAASCQALFERLRVESVLALPTGSPTVVLSGGGSLNILANSRVRAEMEPMRTVLVPPCCDDTGQSLGALLIYLREEVGVDVKVGLPFLGLADHIDAEELGADDCTPDLVDFLASGGALLVHHGASEIGPRALGHRSILSLPTRRSADLINGVLKERAFYRPLAPVVPVESVSEWFVFEGASPHMLYSAACTESLRAAAPGVVHYDGTARVQTVDAASAPFVHRLLNEVGDRFGCPVLINTSLNSRGDPIAARRADTEALAERWSGFHVRMVAAGHRR